MTQNTSHAVMAQRSEPADSLDDFPTPPWSTRALKYLLPAGISFQRCLEPCANRGFMVRPLEEMFRRVTAYDIHDYGCGYPVRDFLAEEVEKTDWIIMNPPFRLAEQFALWALRSAPWRGVALLARTAFLESVGRHERLFFPYPPTVIGQFSERVPMVKGRCDPKASTATAYCWIVWINDASNDLTEFTWIPPCRAELEKPGDYDLPREASAAPSCPEGGKAAGGVT